MLTDRYPNVAAARRLSGPALSYHEQPVDALEVPPELVGLRTMFTALHHLEPQQLSRLLADAARAGQPFAAFDFNQRCWRNLLSVPLLAWLTCWAVTPALPFDWSRLFFTYFVPLVPLIACWDGVVSQLRAYTATELRALAAEASSPAFRWEVGATTWKGIVPITYLLGWPCTGDDLGCLRSPRGW